MRGGGLGRRLFGWSWPLWLAACGPAEGGGPLGWPPGLGGAVFAVRPEGAAEVSYAAFEGDILRDSEAVSLPRRGEAAVAGFEAGLEGLQLVSGPMSSLPREGGLDCDNERPRGVEAASFFAVGGGDGWTPTPGEPELFAAFGMPPLDASACLLAGGCPDRGLVACLDACEAPPAGSPEHPQSPESISPCASCPPGARPGVVACPGGAIFDLAKGGCRPLGPACPSGSPFPEPDAGDPPTLYVSSSAPAGGDGTRAFPFPALDEDVLSRAPPGTRILVAAGTYRPPAEVGAPVWLEGVCVPETYLVGPLTLASSSTLSQVTLGGPLRVESEASAHLAEISVEPAPDGPALRIFGRVRAHGLRVDGVSGLRVFPGGTLVGGAMSVSGRPGIRISGRGRIQDLVLDSSGPGSGASAIAVESVTGRLELSAATIQAIDAVAVEVRGGATFRGSDLEILGAQGARGLRVVNSSSVMLDRTVVKDVQIGLEVEGASLFASDVDVEGCASSGIRVVDGEVWLRRVELREPGQRGVRLTGEGRVEAEDLRVISAREVGIEVGDDVDRGLRSRFHRVRVENTRDVSVLVQQIVVRFEDLAVLGGRIGMEVSPGFDFSREGNFELYSARFEGQEFGLFLERFDVSVSDRFRARDISFRDTRTGISLERCWRGQGELFSTVRVEGEVERAVTFRAF